MTKLTTNALGMLIAKYRCVLRKMLAKNAAVLAASCLLFAAAPACAAEYHVGTLQPYASLADLQDKGVTFADGDVIIIHTTDSSLNAATPFDFGGKTVTVRPAGNDIRLLNITTAGQTVKFTNAANVIITGFKNTSSGYGGAVYLRDGSSFTGDNVTFSGNTASGDRGFGGAIYANAWSGAANINLNTAAGKTSLFSGNKDSGGANSIYFDGYSRNTNTLTIGGDGTLDMRDPMNSNGNNNYSIAITKQGGGTWRLDGENKFKSLSTTGTTFAVNAGALDLYPDAQIDISNQGSFTLGSGATLISRGYKNNSNTIIAPTITINDGSTLGFDLTGADGSGWKTNLILSSGNISDQVKIDILALDGSGASQTFNLVKATSVAVPTNPAKFTLRGADITGTRANGKISLDASSGNILKLKSTAANGIVQWNTTDGTWDATSENWQGQNSSPGGADLSSEKKFLHGDAVVFDGAGSAINIQPNGVQITKRDANPGMVIQAGDWTFTGGKIEGGEIRFLGEGSLTFGADTANDLNSAARSLAQRVTVAGDAKATIAAADNTTLYLSGLSAADGGAINGESGSTIRIKNGVVFANNTASGGGGAVFLWDSSFTGDNVTFSGNTASGGGAIYANAGNAATNITLNTDAGKTSLFSGNTDSGGANSIYFNGYGSNTNNLTIGGDGTLDMRDPINSDGNYNYNIAITKQGGGTWRLDGENKFKANGATGTTFAVNAGALDLYQGAKIIIGTGSFTLKNGAKLIARGGNEIANAAGDIDINDGSTLSFDLSGAVKQGDTGSTTNLTLDATTGGNISEQVIIDINALNGQGKFNLATTSGNVAGSANKLTISGADVGQTRFSGYLVTPDKKTLQLTNNTQNGVVFWTNGMTNNTWNLTDKNWDTNDVPGDGGLSERFFHGDAVVFGGAAGGTIDVQAADVQIEARQHNTTGANYSGLTIEGNADWTFQGCSINGGGGVTKNGAGTLTLKNANNYTGGTTIAGGSLVAGNAGALGTGDVENNAVLQFSLDENASGSAANKITNNGELIKSGAGQLTLSNGGNSYANGTTKIAAGILNITAPDGGLLNFGAVENAAALNFVSDPAASVKKTIGIGSYTGSGTIGLEASLTASEQWVDKMNFAANPQDPVNVKFYFKDVSAIKNMPADNAASMIFAHLDANNDNDSLFQFADPKTNGNLVGANVLAIKTDNSQDFYLAGEFSPGAAKVYSEFSAAGLSLAAGMHSRDFFQAAAQAKRTGKTGGNSTGIYAGYGPVDFRQNTGSHADIKGNRISLGVAWQADEKTTWGIFGQKFNGDYKTENDVETGGQVHSSGNSRYHDFGLFAEYRPQGREHEVLGHYYQAVIKAGRSGNDFRADNFLGGTSGLRSWRSVFGLSVGGGYVKNHGENNTLEYYNHLIYTGLGSDSVTDSIGQKIDFHSADSLKLLSGVRYNFNQNKKTGAYIGAALDWELSGKADAVIDGYRANSASLTGATGIVEVGFKAKQSETLSIDCNVKGLFGKQKGFVGNVALVKMF